MDHRFSDGGQRLQDKAPVGHIRMGKHQIGTAEDLVPEKEKIQIDVPLSPMAFSLPSHLLFDGKEGMEEAFRIPGPFHFSSTVEEFRLVRHPIRFRSKKGRHLPHPDPVLFHQLQSPADILFFIPQVAP